MPTTDLDQSGGTQPTTVDYSRFEQALREGCCLVVAYDGGELADVGNLHHQTYTREPAYVAALEDDFGRTLVEGDGPTIVAAIDTLNRNEVQRWADINRRIRADSGGADAQQAADVVLAGSGEQVPLDAIDI